MQTPPDPTRPFHSMPTSTDEAIDRISDVIDATINDEIKDSIALNRIARIVGWELGRRNSGMSCEDVIRREASPSQEYMNRVYPDGSMTFPECFYENHQTEQRMAALKAGKTIGERLPPPPGLAYEMQTGHLTYEQLRHEAAEAISRAKGVRDE